MRGFASAISVEGLFRGEVVDVEPANEDEHDGRQAHRVEQEGHELCGKGAHNYPWDRWDRSIARFHCSLVCAVWWTAVDRKSSVFVVLDGATRLEENQQ